MPLEPNERFHRDIASAQGNVARRNFDASRRRIVDALGSKDFRTPPLVQKGFQVLGALLALVGATGIAILIVDLFGRLSPMKVLREDFVLLIFGPALLIWGLALIISAKTE